MNWQIMNKVSYKITAFFSIVIIVGVLCMGYFAVSTMSQRIIESAQEKLKSNLHLSKALFDSALPGEWSIQNNKLYKGKQQINENTAVVEIIDSIHLLSGDNVTIFQGDIRVATNVKKTDGSRAIGTKMSENVAQVTLREGKSYFGKADVAGVWNQAAYELLKNERGEIIGAFFVGVPNTPYEKLAEEFRNSLILFAIFGLAFSIIVCYILGRRISIPLEKLAKSTSIVAAGDLSQCELKVTSTDEVGQLIENFKAMITNLRTMVIHVQKSAEHVAASSEELTASTEQATQATTQVASSISEVVGGAEQQSKAITEASAVIGQMSAAIQQISVNTSMVSQSSENTAATAQNGGASVEVAINQMDNIEKTVSRSAQVMVKLNERSKEIGQIVDMISGISGQTNLLALNAAIEAARAGQQGRGFAVVADEVRKLAEQSQEAARQIAELIGEIQKDTEQAVTAMNDGNREVKMGTEVVNKAGEFFREIASSIQLMSGQIKGISAAIEEIADDSQHILTDIQEVAKISKDTLGQMHSVAAATQEEAASMEQISASSQDLAAMAEELQNSTQSFTV